MNTTDSSEAFWKSRAAALRRRVNVARWLESFAPAAFGVLVAGTVAVIACRGAAKPMAYPLTGCAVALTVAAVVAHRRARPRYEGVADALARLDATHALHTRLSSAHAGVGAWPAPADGAALRWRRSRSTDLCTVGAALLVAACLAPLRDGFAMPVAERPEAPPAIRDLQSTIRRLREEKAADPKAVEELEKRAEALLKQPESAWYDATTMEASEHLRDRAEETLRDLDKDLAAMKNTLDRLAESGELRPEELSADMAKNLAEALEGLELSELRPDKATLDKLKALKPGELKPMTKAELEALRRTLAEQQRRLRRAAKDGKASSASRKAASASTPVFLFDPAGLGPVELMKMALGPEHAAAVDGGLLPASETESAIIAKAFETAKPCPRMQSGCKPGMTAPGIIPMPRPAGADPAADDDLLDALEDLVYGDSFSVYDSEPVREALLKALKDGRLRLKDFELKSCNGNCQSGSCSKPGGAMVIVLGTGQGGPGGGGGPAPLTLGDKTAAQAGGKESLNANDRSHDTLGDLQQLTAGKHKVDTNAYKGPVSGGAIATEGDGSEAVWTDNLTPEERETLRKYFK